MLHKDINLKYLYPHTKETKRPVILSQQEVKSLLGNIKNIKHKAILSTCYACGLKVSEVISIKLSDIDYANMRLIIRKDSNIKGRHVMLPQKLSDLLQDYFKEYRPRLYLFEGYNSNQYSVRSVQHILKQAVKTEQFPKNATVHTLRHSFATHLLDQGIDVHFIQQLLGHQSVKTTMLYTQLTDARQRKINSPFDSL